MQTSAYEHFNDTRLHMVDINRLCTALHTKCYGAVVGMTLSIFFIWLRTRDDILHMAIMIEIKLGVRNNVDLQIKIIMANDLPSAS